MTVAEREKIMAFFDEFSWLKWFISPSQISRISVSRVNQQFLDKEPKEQLIYHNEVPPDHYEWEGIYLLNELGCEIGQVGYIPPPPDPSFRWWKFWTWSREKHFSETVSDALARLGNRSGEINFALHIFDGNRGDKYQNHLREVIIYKSPKGFNLQNWAEQLREQARNIVRQQIAAVDSDVVAEQE